ncbi:Protein kinase domain [Macleaya cordata]|uniref:Protein kinase domain n=1 Tax=Macleaya cordata TaxID=56857 RepID=A0A200Q0K6_MACCD|nr:Protein kinase domain [Macleaya cordata]
MGTAPMPQNSQGPVVSMPLSPPPVLPTHNSAPPPLIVQGISPSMPPTSSYSRAPTIEPPITVPLFPDPSVVTPISAPPPIISKKSYRTPVIAPSKETFEHLSPVNHSPNKGSFPVISPASHGASGNVPAPFKSSPRIPESKRSQIPAVSPVISLPNHNYASKRPRSLAPSPAYLFPPSHSRGLAIPPAASQPPTLLPKKRRQRHHGLPPKKQGPSTSPLTHSPSEVGSPAPSPLSTVSSERMKRSSRMKPKTMFPPPVLTLPPPPPNEDCTSVSCLEPLVNTPPGSLCGCVWPMQVGLRFSVALYTFFPLVTELADEIATGVFMKQSQVRIMGANSDGQQLELTVILIDLVPLGEKFDNATAFFVYEKFWNKQVFIKSSSFGDYEVLYVRYPGLPPSPPSAPSTITTIGEGLNSVHGSNARTMHPLAVDIRMKKKGGLGSSMIAIIVLSSSIAIGLCIGAAWLLLRKHGNQTRHTSPTPQTLELPFAKPSGAASSIVVGSGLSSTSGSSIATYTGSAKTFSADEIKRATNNFDESEILGEGGFGLVYRGILDDGTNVAVKVLKRNDQQGGREFLAEVEMLSRLHHRNLVKLIGICTESHSRCLVYELIPNGSVDSHLHALEEEIVPLDWSSRIKIALGAARGLAYLHEDSSPCVIHRDFKSSNILLEHDFTPKVSDFGLARTAIDDGNKHISTHIMGTFGYVAPEYAMTGHLLVKSDVYSYGVVLLELLTGRKPVDMSRPQGQENLVTWARPLLGSKQGLEMIVDPSLGSVPFDSIAKVAAIASMCVQPEVTNRPFMGEVVQALKLVCNECDETKVVSGSCSQEDLSLLGTDARTSTGSDQLLEPSRADYRIIDYDSSNEMTRPLSVSEVFSNSPGFSRNSSGSFRRHSSSGPLRTGRSRQFWERVRGLSRGSMSEHRFAFRLWADSH